jgi:hypothetical protein
MVNRVLTTVVFWAKPRTSDLSENVKFAAL